MPGSAAARVAAFVAGFFATSTFADGAGFFAAFLARVTAFLAFLAFLPVARIA